MATRRELLATIGTSGMLGMAGCSGSNYPTGDATVKYDTSTIESGSVGIVRKHFIDIQAPVDSWGQIHLNLSQNAQAVIVLIAKSGSGTVEWMRRKEWSNYIDEEESSWTGASLSVDQQKDDQETLSLGILRDGRFSATANNYESSEEFEAVLAVGEELDPRFQFSDPVVAERPELD